MSHWLFESVWLICLEEVAELAQQDDSLRGILNQTGRGHKDGGLI